MPHICGPGDLATAHPAAGAQARRREWAAASAVGRWSGEYSQAVVLQEHGASPPCLVTVALRQARLGWM